jgi:uncharacterized protein YkwD
VELDWSAPFIHRNIDHVAAKAGGHFPARFRLARADLMLPRQFGRVADAQYPPHPAPMIAASLQGTSGEPVMRAVLLGAVIAITSTLAHAEDMAEMISRYRQAHGLSAVKTDPQLTAIAERQAKAMAASGIMDHSVAGSFTTRISGVRTGMAAENIAAGTKTWGQTFQMWQTSPGHNANLLLSKADIVGVAVAHNDQTRYKTYWAMVIAEKPSKKKEPKLPAERKAAERQASAGSSENPISAIKDFVCKHLC